MGDAHYIRHIWHIRHKSGRSVIFVPNIKRLGVCRVWCRFWSYPTHMWYIRHAEDTIQAPGTFKSGGISIIQAYLAINQVLWAMNHDSGVLFVCSWVMSLGLLGQARGARPPALFRLATLATLARPQQAGASPQAIPPAGGKHTGAWASVFGG